MKPAVHLLAAAAATFVLAPQARATAGLPDDAALRAWLDPQVAATAAREGFSRYEIELGTPRLPATFAPCERTEPFLPQSGRHWGRLSIGLRCVEGARWTVMVPATVSVWGTAVVASVPLAAGTVLQPQDLQEQEVELTREPAGVAQAVDALAGRTLNRSVNPGQPLRAAMTRATPVVQAGDSVRLRIVGRGFSIAASGQAMNAAGIGQGVRVRTEMGKILNGVAREGRIIDVSL